MMVSTEDEVCEAVTDLLRALPVGGGTKPAASEPANGSVALDVSRLAGVVSYDPAELTFTAKAGTPLRDIGDELGIHGQFLPFEPPLADAGATIGGAVATATSGAGAFGSGGVRDFVTGVRIVDGCGRAIAGGGRVVKNAAGFDLPKLMIGSAGRLGVITEVSCKVFPRPGATATLALAHGSLGDAVKTVSALARGPVAADAIELEPSGRVVVRLAGHESLLAARTERVGQALGVGAAPLGEEEAADYWHSLRELTWVPPESLLVRVPITAALISSVDATLDGAERRYSIAGNLAWVAWPASRPVGDLNRLLADMRLTGAPVLGRAAPPLLGHQPGSAFADRIREALDPEGRFGAVAA